MTKNKKTKTAIVTGGSKGIGLRIAEILANKKYNIVICSRKPIDLLKAKKQIEKYGINCLAIRLDVSNYNDCKSLVKKTIERFSRIDLLINNAGIQGPIGNLWQNNIKEWEKTIKINLFGIFYMCHSVIPHMLRQKQGVIINLSGGGAAYPRPLFSSYASSKTAIVRLTEIMHEELKGKNISVFSLAPGATWTNMTASILRKKHQIADRILLHELKSLKETTGTPFEKLQKMICYLISNRSKKLSGRLIHVNELDKITKNQLKLKNESGLLRRVNY